MSQVLLLDHPRKDIRDTAKYKPFQEMVKVRSSFEFSLSLSLVMKIFYVRQQ